MMTSPVGFDSVDKMLKHEEELTRLRKENKSLKEAVCCLTGEVEKGRYEASADLISQEHRLGSENEILRKRLKKAKEIILSVGSGDDSGGKK